MGGVLSINNKTRVETKGHTIKYHKDPIETKPKIVKVFIKSSSFSIKRKKNKDEKARIFDEGTRRKK